MRSTRLQVVRIDIAFDQAFRARIEELAMLWLTPSIVSAISARFSMRLTSSLGRADAATGRIVLSSSLIGEPELLDQVVCHEVAHVAAFQLIGRSERSHGPTWQRLVREAGYEPLLRLQMPGRAVAQTSESRKTRFSHSCPVCDFTRIASRRMSVWRCADCTTAGLDGRLVVHEVARRS